MLVLPNELPTKCEKINIKNDDEIKQLYDALTDEANKYTCAGLAAPQIGIAKQMFVMRPIWFPSHLYYGYTLDCWLGVVNPEYTKGFLSQTKKRECTPEQCLSFKNVSYLVARHKWIDAKGWIIRPDYKSIRLETSLQGVPSRIFQHECDHCFGITIDKIGRLI